jgi:hypothetical protein
MPPYLIECDLRLGLEDDVPRHARLVPAHPILSTPLADTADRLPAGWRSGLRSTARRPPIGLLAELSGRLRGHRLYTLALARQYQPGAIITQWANPVGVPKHARKPRHIRRKSYFGLLFLLPGTSRANPESFQIVDAQSSSMRPSDSVRLAEGVIRRFIVGDRRITLG